MDSFVAGATVTELAELHGITATRVRQILAKQIPEIYALRRWERAEEPEAKPRDRRIYIPENDWRELKTLAELQGTTQGDIVRAMVRGYLERAAREAAERVGGV